jgi:hypothetical protein
VPVITSKTFIIRDEIKAIPAFAGLVRRIEETGLGVEQEIIDYR